MGTLNPLVEHGVAVSGTLANLPANASTGHRYWDGNLFYIYDDVAGWCSFKPSQVGASSSGGSGIGYTSRQKLADAQQPTGIPLAASASAGVMGLSCTAGTSEFLIGEAAQNNTKTDVALFEVVLPQSYAAGTNINCIVNGLYTAAAGTVPTCTVAAAAYKFADAGTMGSNLIATAAQPLATSAADSTLVITGTTLNPGDRLLIKLTLSIAEGGNTGTLTGKVNSLRLN